jgi:hypothetical protein
MMIVTTIVARAVLPAAVADVVQAAGQVDAAPADALLAVVAPVVDARPEEVDHRAMVTVMHDHAQAARRMPVVLVEDLRVIVSHQGTVVHHAMTAPEIMTVQVNGQLMEIAHPGARARQVATGRSAPAPRVNAAAGIVRSNRAATDRKVTGRSSHVVIVLKVIVLMATEPTGIVLFGHARMVSVLSARVLKAAASAPIHRALPALMVSAVNARSARAVTMIVAARATINHAAKAISRARVTTRCAEIAPAHRAAPAARTALIALVPRVTSLSHRRVTPMQPSGLPKLWHAQALPPAAIQRRSFWRAASV